MSDQLIRLINSASQAILAVLSRPSLIMHPVRETRRGFDTSSIFLREWPVLEVTSVIVGGKTLDAAANYGSVGYSLDPWDGTVPGNPQMLFTSGCFPSTPNSIQLAYTAGYSIQGELQLVPADGYVWPYAPLGRFAGNWKVLDAAGVLMTAIPSGTPAIGQYVPGTPNNATPPTGYVFNPVQGNVQLYYSFTPADIDQACAKWVGEWFSYKSRIGQRSKALASQGGTTSYIIEDMPQDVKLILNQYTRTITV